MINICTIKNEMLTIPPTQMTTKFRGKGARSTGRETPCLGKSWSHCSTQRVILSRHPSADHIRIARLAKSPLTDTA